MLVFLLYVNRRWCFRKTPAFACCDENSLPSKYVHKMGECEPFYFITNSFSGKREIFSQRILTAKTNNEERAMLSWLI